MEGNKENIIAGIINDEDGLRPVSSQISFLLSVNLYRLCATTTYLISNYDE